MMPTEKKALDSSRIETYIGIILGIVTAAIPMTWWLRATLLVVLSGVVCHLWFRHPLTIGLSHGWKWAGSLLSLLIILAISWKPIRSQYRAEHTAPEHIPGADEIAAEVAKRLPPSEVSSPQYGRVVAPTKSLPPEVVLVADETTYLLIWIAGSKTAPTVQPAGKSGYPAMELKNLSSSPVTGVTIDWSVAGPPIEKVIRSSEHFKKYSPIFDHGMYWMDNGQGVGIPAESHDHSDIPYVANAPVPVDIPSSIWFNFFLRMIATKERPPDNSRTPPIKTTEPVAMAVLKYRQSNETYIRTFHVKALMNVLPDSALLVSFGADGHVTGEVGQVDVPHRSSDNLRAQMRFSISESFHR